LRFKNILHIIGALMMFLGLSMVAPLLVSFIYGERDVVALFLSVAITSGVGVLLFFGCYVTQREINHKEGFAIVTFGWIAVACFGSLPYLLSRSLDSVMDAIFESMAGFTTTGATVFASLEGLPHGILLWRSMSQWLGGMGIILLSVAVLPLLGVGGMQLFKAEVPGFKSEKLKPRIAETAKSLWFFYLAITLMEVALLLSGGMNFFDALTHAFTTLSTGGFSTKGLSIAHYHSTYIEVVITFFMFVAGINFTLHFLMIRGGPTAYFKNKEFVFYILTTLLFIALITINLSLTMSDSVLSSLKYASFQVVSILTTTGFTTADYELWPVFSQYLLVALMFIGGSTGSTAGGIKCLRVALLLKQGYREIYRLIHPHAVVPVKIGGKVVPVEVMNSVWGFFFLYVSIFVLATVIMASLGLDFTTAFASVAATLGNIGPGFGLVGPSETFSLIPSSGKGVLVLTMLLGRLELYTVLILFVPEFWRK
jgi:trk system potassium uptake protein TrkH